MSHYRKDAKSSQVWFGRQAVILQTWGRLEEALSLHKKQEAICLELGSKEWLSVSYGNQAVILSTWGRLEEALALLKKQEAICLELADKNGLHRSYGNQALILIDWGRLEEAFALHKKQEAICLELGNQPDLGYCYWQWGRLARKLGDSDQERQKFNAAVAIFTEVQMPLERDAAAADLAKAQAAAANS